MIKGFEGYLLPKVYEMLKRDQPIAENLAKEVTELTEKSRIDGYQYKTLEAAADYQTFIAKIREYLHYIEIPYHGDGGPETIAEAHRWLVMIDEMMNDLIPAIFGSEFRQYVRMMWLYRSAIDECIEDIKKFNKGITKILGAENAWDVQNKRKDLRDKKWSGAEDRLSAELLDKQERRSRMCEAQLIMSSRDIGKPDKVVKVDIPGRKELPVYFKDNQVYVSTGVCHYCDDDEDGIMSDHVWSFLWSTEGAGKSIDGATHFILGPDEEIYEINELIRQFRALLDDEGWQFLLDKKQMKETVNVLTQITK